MARRRAIRSVKSIENKKKRLKKPTIFESSSTPKIIVPPFPLAKAETVLRNFLLSSGRSLLNSRLVDSPFVISSIVII